jgi:hypothetical protein
LKAPNGIDFPPSSLLSFFFLCVTLAAALGGPAMVLPVHNTKLMGGTQESLGKKTQTDSPGAHTLIHQPVWPFIFIFSFCLGLTYLRRDPPQILFLKDFCVRVVQH